MRTSTWRRGDLSLYLTESAPISRNDPESSMHPPMRRRSMVQTPGIATRSVRPGVATARSSARHSLPVPPSLSKASFETDDSIPSLPPLPTPYRVAGNVPRVATPNDGEYSTTGAFKLGSLRITNGSPDLTPAGPSEAEETKPAVSCTDYFSAIIPRTMSVTSEAKKDSSQASTLSTGTRHSEVTPRTARPEPPSSDNAEEPILSINVPTAGCESYYASGIQLSPIEMDEEPLFRFSLDIQSKQTAVEDKLFDTEDDSQPELSAVEKLDVRLDASAKGLPPQPIDDPAQGVQRTDSGFVSNSVSVSSGSHSSLTKADSGYSSSVSLRSFRSGKKALAAEQNTGRGSMESARKSPEITDTDRRHGLELQLPSPITPPIDDTPAKLMSPGRARRKAGPQQIPNIEISKTEDLYAKSSASVSPIPASARSDVSEPSSSLSIGSNVQKHGRLHRLLSLKSSGFSRAPLTVHATHAVDKQVPSVPKDVEQRLREHTGRFPMTTKRLALRSQMSKETLKTILSVGSLEYAMEDELPSTPSIIETDSEDEQADATSGDAVEHSLRQTIISMQSNFKQAAASMMPTKKPVVPKTISTHKEPQVLESRHLVGYNNTLPVEAELRSTNSGNSSSSSNAYDVAAKALTENQVQPGRRAGRSMTLTAEQSNRLQLRTYSLNGMPSSPSNSYLSSSNPVAMAVPPRKTRSPPPISMATRSYRVPPPRTPVNPWGPAVLRKRSREAIRSPTNSPSEMPPLPAFIPSSVDSGRRATVVPASNYRAADWDPNAQQVPLSMQASQDDSRHSSLSSVQSDLSQGHSAPKGPKTRSLSHSDHWGSGNNSRLVEGHQWNKQGYYPPYVSRGQHYRNLSAEHRSDNAMDSPPYRVLHSYNSPAYRNAPIWG